MSEMKLTRKEQARETKQLLFNTALKLLDEKDFDQITIRDIVKKAHVSIGTFYNYYATKLDVYYETYLIADEFFETTVKENLLKVTDLREKVLLFFDYYAKYSCEITNIKLTKILYNSRNKCFDRESETGMMPLLTSIFEEGLEKDIVHSDMNAKEISLFLMIAARGQVYHWCTNDGSYDLRQAVKRQMTLLLKIFII